jgi:uncharacterized protein YndB with AHSA1/START domain
MTVEPLTVRVERLLPGPIELVWDYLTKPELLATWLYEGLGEANPRPEIQRCEPPAVLENAWNGDSTVRFDLETRGQDVLLRLTHRRLPACFIGVFTVLAVGLAFFTLNQPADTSRPQQQMGTAQLKFHSSDIKPLYGMLGGRC